MATNQTWTVAANAPHVERVSPAGAITIASPGYASTAFANHPPAMTGNRMAVKPDRIAGGHVHPASPAYLAMNPMIAAARSAKRVSAKNQPVVMAWSMGAKSATTVI